MRVLQMVKLVAPALVLCAVAPQARSQEKFPSKPIEMVIPTAAGGGTDIAFRMLAELAEPALGQKVVIVNKTGGGGAVGMMSIVQSKPDGYTIGGLWNAPLTMTPHMLPMPYKSTDYATITLSTWAPTVMCTKPAFPAATGQDLIAELKKNPEKYTYGNDGVGGTIHLAFERVFSQLGVKAVPVPFNGAGETLKAFLGDHVDLYAGSIAPILPYVKDKSARCLLLTSAERSNQLPDAASLTDIGLPKEATVLWRGIIGPKSLPADKVAILQKAFADAAKSDKFKKFMESRGEEAKGSTATELRTLIDTEYAAMGKVMATAGLVKK